jgi:MFS family permease
MTGVLFFTAASLMCGLAWSPGALLTARVVQGAGAAIMTSTALSIISTTFPEGAERNKTLGIWGALGGIGVTAAWLIGGPLSTAPAGSGSSSSTSPSAWPGSRCRPCF